MEEGQTEEGKGEDADSVDHEMPGRVFLELVRLSGSYFSQAKTLLLEKAFSYLATSSKVNKYNSEEEIIASTSSSETNNIKKMKATTSAGDAIDEPVAEQYQQEQEEDEEVEVGTTPGRNFIRKEDHSASAKPMSTVQQQAKYLASVFKNRAKYARGCHSSAVLDSVVFLVKKF